MTNYKHPREKATETATFRLTRAEKKMLSHLADLEGCSQTDLLRGMLATTAVERGVLHVPEAATSRPSHPPKRKPTPRPSIAPSGAPASESPVPPILRMPGTFGELVVRFQAYSEARGEKMQNELDATVQFVIGRAGSEPLLLEDQPLFDINSFLLREVREKLKDADMRFPVKNLHLTYLRMMFNYALKEKMGTGAIDPPIDLRAFTAKEVADAFPMPIKTL